TSQATVGRGTNYPYEIAGSQEKRVANYVRTGNEAELNQQRRNRTAAVSGTWGAAYSERAGMGF
ncbi:MAG: hypothetical protein EBV19_10385, partial [Flavobacteriia bacterium]|nr:hypothetical protein [Flavobacteriia bacterium]